MKNASNSSVPPRPSKNKDSKLHKLKSKLSRLSKKIGTLSTRSASADRFTDAISLGLSDKLGFGKYKSKTLRKIATEDPLYLVWLLEHNDTIRVNKAVKSYLTAFVETGEDSPDKYDPDTYDWSGMVDISETF